MHVLVCAAGAIHSVTSSGMADALPRARSPQSHTAAADQEQPVPMGNMSSAVQRQRLFDLLETAHMGAPCGRLLEVKKQSSGCCTNNMWYLPWAMVATICAHCSLLYGMQDDIVMPKAIRIFPMYHWLRQNTCSIICSVRDYLHHHRAPSLGLNQVRICG